jgi:hypothetical protein
MDIEEEVKIVRALQKVPNKTFMESWKRMTKEGWKITSFTHTELIKRKRSRKHRGRGSQMQIVNIITYYVRPPEGSMYHGWSERSQPAIYHGKMYIIPDFYYQAYMNSDTFGEVREVPSLKDICLAKNLQCIRERGGDGWPVSWIKELERLNRRFKNERK